MADEASSWESCEVTACLRTIAAEVREEALRLYLGLPEGVPMKHVTPFTDWHCTEAMAQGPGYLIKVRISGSEELAPEFLVLRVLTATDSKAMLVALIKGPPAAQPLGPVGAGQEGPVLPAARRVDDLEGALDFALEALLAARPSNPVQFLSEKLSAWSEPPAPPAAVELSEGLTAELMKLFAAIDADGNGKITKEEGEGHFKSWKNVNVKAMFKEVDTDVSGDITAEEWLGFWKNVLSQQEAGGAQRYTEAEILEELVDLIEGKSWVDFDDGRTTE